MDTIKIKEYCGLYDDEIVSTILTIQTKEFGLPITKEDQPDICNIKDFYQKGNGNFWLAIYNDKVVGTQGLLDIGNNQAVLRKLFVNKDFRKIGITSLLYKETLKWAKEKNFNQIFLGTTDFFTVAHKVYEKYGFTEISKSELPPTFPVMKVDTKFFKLAI